MDIEQQRAAFEAAIGRGKTYTERDFGMFLLGLNRQGRGEPVAWHSKQYGVVWMAIKPGNLVAGTQWFIQGRQEPVAEIISPVSLVWHVATSELAHGTVFYASPQPTKPVVKESLTAADPVKAEFPDAVEHYGTAHDPDAAHKLSAEPVKEVSDEEIDAAICNASDEGLSLQSRLAMVYAVRALLTRYGRKS